MRLEYQECNFPTAVDDRLQRHIFIIGLNDTFKKCDIISRETLTALTFAQVISKARDFGASLQTESVITKQQLEKSAHKVIPCVPIKRHLISQTKSHVMVWHRGLLVVGESANISLSYSPSLPLAAYGVAAHLVLYVGIVPLRMTLVIGVANGVIGNRFAGHLILILCFKLISVANQGI